MRGDDIYLGDVYRRHESLKNHCDSEQSVKFEKHGWKNAVLSAYLMRGVFHSTGCAESYTTCDDYYAPF